MEPLKISFIIGQLSDDEIEVLQENRPLVSKMILSADDFQLFRYKKGDAIQVETHHGNRLWCKILELEIVEKSTGAILIFTLVKSENSQP
jgi:hypothetical protein